MGYHCFEVCPLNDREILLVSSKNSEIKRATFDAETKTIGEISSDRKDCFNRLLSLTQLSSNEVLFAGKDFLVKHSRLGSSDSQQLEWAYLHKRYPEMKEIVTKEQALVEFDYNLAIRLHDTQLGQLDADEGLLVHRWEELHWLKYYFGTSIYDLSLRDCADNDWYPLKVAKEQFPKQPQHLSQEEFACFLK